MAEKKTAIKEYTPIEGRTKIAINVDTDILLMIKTLAKIKNDSYGALINDILRSFAERNKDIFNNFKKYYNDFYDKIQW